MTDRNAAKASEPEHLDDEMLTMKEVVEVVRFPVATLRYWRHLATGPRSFKTGRSVRHWRTEVWAWITEQTNRPQDHQ